MKTLALAAVTLCILSGCSQSASPGNEISIADSTHYQLGEGALWDWKHNRLLYIDIIEKKLMVWYPEPDQLNTHEMPSMIGTVVAESKEEVRVALEDGIYRYNLETGDLTFLANPPENDSTQRFNDGKCDPAGRFWVGTISVVGNRKSSHLFRHDGGETVKVMLDSITISNGIVWSSDGKKMYYIDTPTRKVMEYRFNLAEGTISEPRVCVSVPDSLGAPDGMAIDSEDHLWVAMWGGSAVCRFDPENGTLKERIMVPAKNVTSCAFGGEDLRTLYITTARAGTGEEELQQFPDAGALFSIRTSIRGVKSPYAK